MKQYLELLQHTLDNGRVKKDRTGTGTVSVFGTQTRYDLADNKLPMVTTKKLFSNGVIRELLWMLFGSTNVHELNANDVRIWDEWADDNGNLGPVYGEMWRKFPAHSKLGMGMITKTVDQIAEVERQLKEEPNSRRIIVSGWHPGLLPDTSKSPSRNASEGKQALPPCHTLFQFICEPMTVAERWEYIEKNPIIEQAAIYIDDKAIESISEDSELSESAHAELDRLNVPRYLLSCQLYQRSADLFLGVPFNIMSYALLTHMLAKTNNMVAKEFIHTTGDAHIYLNHLEQVNKQLGRTPKASPTVEFNSEKEYNSVLDFSFEDIAIKGYKSHPAIKGEVSV